MALLLRGFLIWHFKNRSMKPNYVFIHNLDSFSMRINQNFSNVPGNEADQDLRISIIFSPTVSLELSQQMKLGNWLSDGGEPNHQTLPAGLSKTPTTFPSCHDHTLTYHLKWKIEEVIMNISLHRDNLAKLKLTLCSGMRETLVLLRSQIQLKAARPRLES